MKIGNVSVFGFVLYVTVTACSGPEPSTHGDVDSGVLVLDIGDSGDGRLDAGTVDLDADVQVPLIVTPTAPILAPCTSPYAPVLEVVPTGELLPVFADSTDSLSVGVAQVGAAAPNDWRAASSVDLPTIASTITVFAQLPATACPDAIPFVHQYSVQPSFAPAAGLSGSTAIAKDDPRFSAWATKVLDVNYGENVTPAWQTPEKALGQATDSTTDVVSLGEGGSITLGFDATLVDGDGYDFAVFENGFGDNYLELAFVEVSSDGVQFIRFDTASLVSTPKGAYGTLDPEQLEGFAGKYRVGFGTPFDLGWLKARPEVRSGIVNLSQIKSIRIVDIVGDGRNRDSFGHVIYDPYPTTGSAGFDLEAIGLLNAVP